MTAAKTCSIWAVRILLHGNVQADPNKVDKQNFTALDYALKANNSRIINILAEVTTVFSERSIETLAQSKVRIGDGGHIEKYIQKIINYSDTPEHRTVNYYDAEGAKYYYDAREPQLKSKVTHHQRILTSFSPEPHFMATQKSLHICSRTQKWH